MFDCLGTDHAPHTLAEKEKPYPASPSGMPGVQTLVPVMLDHVAAGRLSLERFVDMTSAGHLRGYAQLAGKPIAADERRLDHLVGKGQLAFTVDQGPDTERYQGIVELGEDTLAGAADHYFKQSEQLSTRLILASGLGTAWRSTALMVQRLPGESPDPDAWNRTLHLLDSLTEDELLDPDLKAEDLLYRLFHAEGVRVFSARPVEARCRCTRERAEGALRLVPESDLPDLMVDGRFIVTCQFCNSSNIFSEEDVRQLRAS